MVELDKWMDGWMDKLTNGWVDEMDDELIEKWMAG